MKLVLLAVLSVAAVAQTVTPSAVTLRAAGTTQFTASIPSCLWSTPIGSVNLAGFYQAPLVIPFAMTTTVTCATTAQSASATVTLTPSSLPVAGLEYIRGGNFAGTIIVLAIQPPLVAANGQFLLNGATVTCPPSGCQNITLTPNGDGTVTPSVPLTTGPQGPPGPPLNVLLNNQAIGTASGIDFASSKAPAAQQGIVWSCAPDSATAGQIDCSQAFNTAVILTYNALVANPLFCNSQNGTTAYTCTLRNFTPTAAGLPPDMMVLLTVDTPNFGPASLVVNNTSPTISIKQSDGTTDPAPNSIVPGKAYLLFFDGQVWRPVSSF